MATRSKTRGARGRTRITKKKAKSRKGLFLALRDARNRFRQRFGRQTDDLWGLLLIVVAVLLVLAFIGLAGPFGRWTTTGLRFLFGIWAFFIPTGMAVVGAAMLGTMPRKEYGRIAIGVTILYFASLVMMHLVTGTVSLATSVDLVSRRGGAVGSLIAFPMRRVIGFWGAFVLLTAALILGALVTTKATVRDVGAAIASAVRHAWWSVKRMWRDLRAPEFFEQDVIVEQAAVEPPARTAPKRAAPASGPRAATTSPKKAKPKQPPPPSPKSADGAPYSLPPLELLELSAASAQNRRTLEQTAAELEESLRQHGVDARLTRIVPGPTVTRYEIELAPGVKVSRVTGLSHDIAYALASADVRILAPIPGKSAIGIEVPNRRRQLVTLGDILSSQEAGGDPDPLAVGLGKDISGKARMLALHELPHMLIAGATGAGKSSCINAIVTSLLMRASPEEVRLILVDPKRVELGQYNGAPHLLTRVITNPKKASDALQWAVHEMDRRYELLAEAGVRDIDSYREKWDAGGLEEDAFDRFPYIVIIVDELNDLMMVAGRAVEDSVVRIAQMARAVGIHLVLATQRPSVNVITGVIKANVPSRLAFSVTSQTDSRVILDASGAEKLVGLGDMLVVTAREPKPERIQGAFVSEREVTAVVDWTKQQQKARYEERMFEAAAKTEAIAEEFEGEDPDIIRQAIDLIVRSRLGSTSMLQRKLRIGFARAGRVMDIIERKGIVGPSEGSKAREVLITIEELEELTTSTPVG